MFTLILSLLISCASMAYSNTTSQSTQAPHTQESIVSHQEDNQATPEQTQSTETLDSTKSTETQGDCSYESFDRERADKHFDAKEYEEAKGLYLQVLRNPQEQNKALVFFRLGLIHITQKDYLEAQQYFQAALKQIHSKDPLQAPIHYNLAHTYISLNKRDELGHWIQVLSKSYIDFNKKEKALEHLKQAFAADSQDPAVIISLGKLQVLMHQYNDAIKTLQNGLDLHPNDHAIMCVLGQAYTHAQKIQDAKELYQKILTHDPIHFKAKYALAKILEAEGNFEDAEKTLISLISVYPQRRILLKHYGIFLTKRKNYAKAIDIFTQVFQTNQNDTEAHKALGQIYFIQGQYHKSLEHLHKSLIEAAAQNPHTTQIHEKIGDAYFNSGEHNKALQYYFLTLLSSSEQHKIKEKIAQSYLKQRYFSAAIDMYLELIKHNNKKPEYFQRLGEAYALRGDKENATKIFTHITRKFQNYEHIKTIESYLHSEVSISGGK